MAAGASGDSLARLMSAEPPRFPPPRHVTRDLAIHIRRQDGRATLQLPIVPEILDASGRVRVGVVATIADVIAGEAAVREALPGWMATLGLSLQVGDLPGEGHLTARSRLIRKGRTTLVYEVELEHAETDTAVALSTLTFSLLPARTDLQARAIWAETPDPETRFATEDSGFRAPLLDTAGFAFDPSDLSTVRLEKTAYVGNTLEAVTGGMVATLAEVAADHHAARELGGATRVRSLEVHFLKLARVGPLRASARTLGTLGAASIVRVELRDEGQDDTLTTLATVVVERVGA